MGIRSTIQPPRRNWPACWKGARRPRPCATSPKRRSRSAIARARWLQWRNGQRPRARCHHPPGLRPGRKPRAGPRLTSKWQPPSAQRKKRFQVFRQTKRWPCPGNASPGRSGIRTSPTPSPCARRSRRCFPTMDLPWNPGCGRWKRLDVWQKRTKPSLPPRPWMPSAACYCVPTSSRTTRI